MKIISILCLMTFTIDSRKSWTKMLHSNCYRASEVNLPTSLGFRKESWLPFKISKKCIKRILLVAVKSQKTSYKASANKLTKVKCLAKKLYFHSELENCKGDGRKIWDLLYSLLPSKKNKQCPKTLKVGDGHYA